MKVELWDGGRGNEWVCQKKANTHKKVHIKMH